MEFRAQTTSVKVKDNLPPPKIFRAADFLWNAPTLLRVYGRVNYTFDCKFVSKSLFNWGIIHIPYSFRKSFEKCAQFASPNALQNNLHIERNRLCAVGGTSAIWWRNLFSEKRLSPRFSVFGQWASQGLDPLGWNTKKGSISKTI